jgi:hypothetical protein
MDIFLHCYSIAFPVNIVHIKDIIKKIGSIEELKYPVTGSSYETTKERQQL